MKLSLRFVCLALVIAALGFVLSTQVIPSHAATSPATIQTDQKHYSVGATMGISGAGFSSGVTITLTVVRPDQLTDVVPGVTTDSSGSFHATYTPPQEPGRYKLTATDGAVSATTASTEADAIGFNKAVYRKADTTYAGGAGTWTTGEAGSNYVENQWAFYQYQPTGFTSAIPDFDVQFNYHEASSGAIFVDAFANFRACVTAYKSNGQIIAPNNCEDTDSSGLLSDGHHAPTTTTTHWIDAHTAISNINHSISTDGSSCLATADPVDTIANDTHCFHVNGTTLRTLLLAADPNVFSVPTADNYAVSLYYAAHLAATAVWHPFSGTTGNEALLGCYGNGNYVVHTLGTNFTGAGTEFVPAPAPAVAGVPVGTYGTDVYDPDLDPCDTPVVGEDFTVKAFLGIGSASGASRHFTLANPQIGGVSVGSQGAITLPIPSVAAPSGTITIVKVTSPANSGTATFSFAGDLGSFVLDTNSADATNPSSKTIINVPGGESYTVTETEPSGWSPAGNAVCVNNTGTSAFSTTGTSATIDFADTANAAVTCTFTNNGAGHIVVDKVTNPSGDPTSFSFTTTGTGYSGFSLTDAAAPNDQTLSAGTYTVAETATSGWTLTNLACVETVAGAGGNSFPTGPTTTQPASITLAVGATITCTFTNTQSSSLAIQKTVVGAGTTFNYGVTGSGLSAFTRTPATNSTTAAAAFPFDGTQMGDKYVTETVPTGYTLTNIACTANGATILIGTGQGAGFAQGTSAGFDAGDTTVKVTVGAGNSPTCTFTNTQNSSLAIQKTVVGAGTTFNYGVTGSGLSAFTRTPAANSTTAAAAFPFDGTQLGDKYVTETVPTGYTLTSIACTANGATILIGTGQGAAFAQGTSAGFDAGDTTVKVTVHAGDTPTCTFTNTQSSSLAIQKTVVGAGTTFNYGVTGSGLSAFTRTPATNSTTAAAAFPFDGTQLGDKYVTETVPTGYTLTNIACTANGATILIGTGQGAGFAQGTSAGFDAGDTTVKVTVGAGNSPTCTFTNTQNSSLAIQKTVVGAGTTFNYGVTGSGLSAFTRTPAANSTTAAAAFPFDGTQLGDKYVTETVPTGYTLTSIACTANGATILIGTGQGAAFAQGTSAGFDAGDTTVKVTVHAGDTPTCTFTNTQTASLAIQKSTVGGVGSFSYSVSGSGLSGFTRNTGTQGNPTTTTAFSLDGTQLGDKYVTETVPAGWALTNIACTANGATVLIGTGQGAAFAQGTSAGFDAGDTTVKVTVGAGNSPTCTFTNTKLATLVVTKTTVGGIGSFGYSGTNTASFTLATTVAGAAGKVSTSAATVPSFSNITPGTVKNVIETTVPVGWALAGQPTCAITTTGTGSSTSAANTTAGVTVTLGAGDTVTCNFVNDLLPTLTIHKTVQGTGTGTFSFDVTGANTLNSGTIPSTNITPASAPATASFGPYTINTGTSVISEHTPLPAGDWTLTDATCTGYTAGAAGDGPGTLDVNGVPTNWTFTAQFGNNIVCSYVNNNAQASRTQGFWATHTTLSNNIWNGTNLPAGATKAGDGIDNFFSGGACGAGFTITADPTTGENILMGGFWSSIAQKTTNPKNRTSIDQTRMQMIQQYLAAVLNYHMFGSIGETVLANARTAYCGNSQSAIQGFIGTLGNLNQSGDQLGATPGGSATTQISKSQADIDAWDTPTHPVD